MLIFRLKPALNPLGNISNYSINQKVNILYKQTYYPGTVIEVKDNMYKVRYDNYSTAWDEWVYQNRITPINANANATNSTFQLNDNVKIFYKNLWYPGKIISLNNNSYKVHYDNYDDSWDEWVDASRLKK